MSLNYDATKVKDFEINFPDVIRDGVRYSNSVLESVVFYCMFLDMEGVNEKNIDEFVFRFRFYTRLFSHLYYSTGENGEKKGFEITKDILKKLVGLSVNVCQKPRNEWVKHIVKNLSEEIERQIRKENSNASL